MLYYRQFDTTPDVAYNIQMALIACRERGARGLVFDPGEYHVKADYACERMLAMSNHGDVGLKRICFLLEGLSDFTVDGGGSTFIFEDIIQAAALIDCHNVTLQNMSFVSRRTKNTQATVVRAEGRWMDIQLWEGEPWFLSDGELLIGERYADPQRIFYFDEYDGQSGQLVEKHAEYMCYSPDGALAPHLTFSLCEDGCVHVDGLRRPFTAGNGLVLGTESRCAANILAQNCVNTTVRNVTIYSGIGMGLIAQGCDGVEVDRMNTRIPEGRLFSINSDATHFVHCKGNIHVHDCYFEGQHDDAINVHSVYLRVVDKRERGVIVRFMHPETRGIDIFRAGDRAAVIDSQTLFSRGEVRVAKVTPLNIDHIEITLTEDSDLSLIHVGDCLHESAWHPTVLFERCTLVNNRARGLLLDGGAEYTIRQNLIRTPGPAIRFGGEASYWYESCGGERVLVENNVFENCAYAGWGAEVIGGRHYAHVEGQYIHGEMTVRGNVFRDCARPLADLYGFSSVCFEDNVYENCDAPTVRCTNCDKVVLQKENEM